MWITRTRASGTDRRRGRSTLPGVETLESRIVPAPLAPLVALRHDSGPSAVDAITCDGTLRVEAATGATIAYSTRPGVWVSAQPTPREGVNSVAVRQVDPYFGASPVTRISFVLDTVAPRTPEVFARVGATKRIASGALSPADTIQVRHEAGTTAAVTAIDGRPTHIPLAAAGGTTVRIGDLVGDPGPHAITVTVLDVAGNSASVNHAFRLAASGAAPTGEATASGSVPAGQPAVPAPMVPKSNPFVVNVREYGAVGDNATDDSAAIRSAWSAAVLTGQPLYFPAGTYRVGTGQLLLSLEQCRFTGLTVYGDGVGRSIINCMDVATSPQMLVTCPTRPGDSVFLSMKGIGVYTRIAGTGVQFGARDYHDPINEPELDLMVLNFDRTKQAVAVELNYVLNGDIRLVANTAGAGTSLLLRQAEFNRFTGSYGGVGGVSVRLADGFNTGNVFIALDMENVAICVVSTSPHNLANTFVGGTWSYTRNGLVSTAGRRLVIFNPQLNLPPPGKVSAFFGAAVGARVWPTPPVA